MINQETGSMNKGAWSKEEDELLTKLVDQHGAKNWASIAKVNDLK